MTPAEAYGWLFDGKWALIDMGLSLVAGMYEDWASKLFHWHSGISIQELRALVIEERSRFLQAARLYKVEEVRARLFLYATLLSVEHPV